MQRQLIIMRHAKSSWATEGLSDHERPLNPRGRRAALRVAIELQRLGWLPQFVLSSDAQRTRETAMLMLAAWDSGIEAEYSPSLYLAGPSELAEAMAAISDEVETLIAIGHNPGWESVVHRLSGTELVMKTATAAMLRADCDDWSEAFDEQWSLESVILARELEC